MATITLPAGTKKLRFLDSPDQLDGVAHMVAAALHPLDGDSTGSDALAYALTCDQIQAALIEGARFGTFGLTVPPLVLPQFKLDAAQLQNAMMNTDDLRAFAASYGVEVNAREQTATPAPVVAETTEQRRARWLDLYGEGERGAVKRVYTNELLTNPKADRSFIGKEIEKAKQEKEEAKRGGSMFSQLVQDGKRQN